jgi:hypothetical protein
MINNLKLLVLSLTTKKRNEYDTHGFKSIYSYILLSDIVFLFLVNKVINRRNVQLILVLINIKILTIYFMLFFFASSVC